MQNNCTERLEWLDAVKGIGILFVVIGHHLLGVNISWIYCFHMPLFFMVSGYIFAYKAEWHKPFFAIVVNKLKGLMYPYLTLSVIVIIWHILFYDVLFSNTKPEFSSFEAIILTITTYGYHALWFLPCLFLAYVFFAFLRKHSFQHICLLIMIALLFISFCDTDNKVIVYFFRFFAATVFIYFGYIMYFIMKKSYYRYVVYLCICLSVISIIVYGIFSDQFPMVNISVGSIGNPFVFYLFAIANSISLIELCKKATFLNCIFGIWGKNSLVVMAIHMDITIEIAYLIIGRIPYSFNETVLSVLAIIIEFVILYLVIKMTDKKITFIHRFPKK